MKIRTPPIFLSVVLMPITPPGSRKSNKPAPGFSRAACLALFLLLAAAAPAARAADYDISYLWHTDRAKVTAYKAAVIRILGPEVARGLREVLRADGYGLIYKRRGGPGSAKAVAAAHSRLLTRAGLGPAVPVQDRDWAAPVRATSPAVVSAAPGAAPESSPLESDIENFIRGLRRRGLIKDNERTAWLVYDIRADRKLASINEDMPFEAASLIKPFIALAYLHEVKAGRRPYTDEVRARMERMIRESDNAAADWVMRRLGGPKAVQRLLSREYGGIFKNTSIVETIPASGRTYRNKASARDYSRFLYALWNGGFPGSGELKRLMNLSNPDRLYTAAPGVPPGTEVYDKTGTTSHLCGDMGILVSRRADGEVFPYIIVGIIEKERSARSYFNWMRARGDVIRRVSEMAYKEISGLYRFSDFDPVNAESRAADVGKAGETEQKGG